MELDSYKLKLKRIITSGKQYLLKAVNVPYTTVANDITDSTLLKSSPIIIDVLSKCISHNAKLISVTQPKIGSVGIYNSDNIIYYPPTNNAGLADFKYTISDGFNSATGNIYITVNPIPPTAVDDTADCEINGSVNINVLSNDDNGGEPINRVILTKLPIFGTALVNNDKTITYTFIPPVNNDTNKPVIFVDFKLGNDGNNGTPSDPVATIRQASELVDNNGTIIIINKQYKLYGLSSGAYDGIVCDGKTITIDFGNAFLDLTFNSQIFFSFWGTQNNNITIKNLNLWWVSNVSGSKVFENGGCNVLGRMTTSLCEANNNTLTITDCKISGNYTYISYLNCINDTTNIDHCYLLTENVYNNKGDSSLTNIVILDSSDKDSFIELVGANSIVDSFIYKIFNSKGSSSATVKINSIPIAKNPIAKNDSFIVTRGETYTFDPRINDDTGGGSLVLDYVSPGSYGTTIIDNLVNIKYTTNDAIYIGSDKFTYSMKNETGASTGTVDVTIIGNPPIAVNDSISVIRGKTITFDPTTNDNNGGGTISIITINQGNHGSVINNGDKTLTYKTTDGIYVGSDSFNYTIVNLWGTSTGSVSIDIKPSPPIAVDDNIIITSDAIYSFNPLLNDDLGGANLGIKSVTQPSHGTVVKSTTDGLIYTILQYTPNNSEYVGDDIFTYTIGNSPDTSTATVHTTISLPTPPIANDDNISVDYNNSITFDPTINDSIGGYTLSIISITSPINGIASKNGKNITYTPNSNYVGNDTFKYKIDNGHGTSTGTINVTINPGLPTATDDTLTIIMNQNDSGNDIDVMKNDNGNGDTITIDSYTNPKHGTVSRNLDKTLKYLPNQDYTGTDTFTYTIKNLKGTATANVNITITPPPPIAYDDTISLNRGGNILINPKLNDSGWGASTTITAITQGNYGSSTIVNNGSLIKYDLTGSNYVGTDSINYTIETISGTSTAKINITINSVPPIANGVSKPYTVIEGMNIIFDPTNNDDTGGETIHISSTDTPPHGIISIDGTKITYTAELFVENFTLNYTITNSKGSSTSTFTINVIKSPSSPTAVDDSIIVDKGGNITFNPIVNDDSNGLTLSITGITQGSHGTVVNNNDNTLTYTCSNNSYVGSDTFTYTISNGSGVDVGNVNVTINPSAPVAHNYDVTVSTGNSIIIDPITDSDNGGGTLILLQSLPVSPLYGNISFNNNITYTCKNNTYIGNDSFKYSIKNSVEKSIGTVNIIITPNPPISSNQYITIAVGNSIIIDLTKNSYSGNGKFYYNGSSDPNYGHITSLNDDQTIMMYSCFDNIYIGNDSFIYAFANLNNDASVGTIDITIIDATPFTIPIAINDTLIITKNQNNENNIFCPLLNDDIGGDPSILISNYIQPNNGTIIIDNHGFSFTYTPNTDFIGEDSFTYTITNSVGSSTATVDINVIPPPPITVDDHFSLSRGECKTFDPTLNDDGQTLPITLSSISSNQYASIENNLLKYDLTNSKFVGDDSLNYTIETTSGSAQGTIYITVNPVPPTAYGGVSITVITGNSIIFDPTLNDDNGGNTIYVSSTTTPSNGIITIDANSTRVNYQANSTFIGTMDIGYTISDSIHSSSSIFTINVKKPPLIPVTVDDSISLSRGKSITFDSTLNDDAKGFPLTIFDITQGSHGSITNNNDNTLTYTCLDNVYVGSDTFTYTINNGIGKCTGNINVTINPVSPIAHNYNYTIYKGGNFTINPLTDSDNGGGTLILTSNTSTSTHATISTSLSTITYQNNNVYMGTDLFTYVVKNEIGNSTGTVNIITTAAPPTAANYTVNVQRGSSKLIDVLLNSDNGGEDFNISSVETPSHGTYSKETKIYTCSDNIYVGYDAFSYVLTNSIGSGTGTVSVAVVPTIPTTTNDNINCAIYSNVTFDPRINDDYGGDTILKIINTSTPTHGSTTILIHGTDYTIKYTNTDGYVGKDSFSYTVENVTGQDTGMIYVNILPSPPIAVDDEYSVINGKSISIDPRTNDNKNQASYLDVTEINSTSLSNSVTTNHGIINLNNDGTLTYTSNDSFIGDDTFTYTISSYNINNTVREYMGTSIGNITMHINPEPPTAIDDSITVSRGGSITFNPLANDKSGGETISISSVTQGSHGSIVINDNSTLTYKCSDNVYIGNDSFTYTITSSAGFSTATISVNITFAAPIANSTTTITVMRSATSNKIPTVIDNGGADGYTFETRTYVTSKTNGLHGTTKVYDDVAMYFSQKITYQGNGDYVGLDSFSFVVRNPSGTSTGTINVNVIPDLPIAMDDTLTIQRNTPGIVDVMANDDDGGGTISIVDFSNGLYGTVELTNKKLKYTPTNPYYVGSDSFTYTIANSTGSSIGNVSISVVILPPTAHDDSINVDRGKTVTFDPRTNDEDGAGILEIINVDQGIHGTSTISDDKKQITYKCDSTKYVGTDVFAYTISNITNNEGGTSFGNVTININPIAPVASDISINLNRGATATVSTIVDNGGETISITNSIPSHGNVTINNDQIIYGCTNNVYIGDDTFTYTATNSKGNSTANVNVIINPAPPIAVDDSKSVKFSNSISFDPTTNDDNGGGTLTLSIISNPSYGIATISSGTSISYTAPTNYTNFQYTLTDENGYYYNNDVFKYTITNKTGNSTGNITMKIWTDLLVLFHRDSPNLSVPNSISGNGLFGKSISIDNNVMVIGSPGETINSNANAGAIYIYEKDSTGKWVQQNKFTAPSGNIGANYQFGFSVSVSNDLIVVGAPYEKNGSISNAGACYTYIKGTSGWAFDLRYTNSPSIAGVLLGYSVSAYCDSSNKYFIASIPYATANSKNNAGKVVIRKKASTWSTVTTLDSGSSNAVTDEHFGISISLYGNNILIGSDKNEAYLFTNGSSWTLTTRYTKTDEQFGSSVSLANDRFIVGAPGSNKVYIYKLSDGSLEATLDHSIHTGYSSGDGFGTSISMDRYYTKYIVVGCPNFSSNSGKMYVYEYYDSSWVPAGIPDFTETTPTNGNKFGSSICISNKRVGVGVPNYDSNKGSVDFYE